MQGLHPNHSQMRPSHRLRWRQGPAGFHRQPHTGSDHSQYSTAWSTARHLYLRTRGSRAREPAASTTAPASHWRADRLAPPAQTATRRTAEPCPNVAPLCVAACKSSLNKRTAAFQGDARLGLTPTHLCRDWAHICAGTGLIPAHICAGTGGPLQQMPSCGGDHLHPA
jgi:hypothetical protein